MHESSIEKAVSCQHCGNACTTEIIRHDDAIFCCQGCALVFDLLHENGLDSYYAIEKGAGINLQGYQGKDWAYLDNENFSTQFINYKDDEITKISFHLPAIHCSACIWLLEKLYKLNPAISQSRVDFSRKEASITFKHREIKLSEVVALLHSIGYTPDFQNKQEKSTHYRKLIYQIGIAGFCFGNIMLFSLPEYFGAPLFEGSNLANIFPYLIALLALPVFFYSAQDYFKSSWAALRQRNINMDVPIVLGIITLLLYSYWEIFSQNGQGYLDSLAALVFFLLIGKLYQQKTYDHLKFDRDFKSYFPLTAQKWQADKVQSIPLSDLQIGDIIEVKHGEIIPADSLLIEGNAKIDYSFVTGESRLIEQPIGHLLYAGGKQNGAAIRLRVNKAASQSYLTKLWNNEAFTTPNKLYFESLANKISQYFTPAIIFIALLSGAYWLLSGTNHLALKAFTSVLIIACPCALALTSPVTLGSAIRVLGKYKFYVKNAAVVEAMANIDTIVFDKTGTLTKHESSKIAYHGQAIDSEQKALIYNLLRHSIHPLSKEVSALMHQANSFPIQAYQELENNGVSGFVDGHLVRAGKRSFVGSIKETDHSEIKGSRVHISIDDEYIGYFELQQAYREGMVEMIKALSYQYSIHLLSGDSDQEKADFEQIFGKESQLHFNQSPEEKLHYIANLQESGSRVMMFGDGLNDAGALKKSDVGVAVTENTSFFSPACDVIMEGSALAKVNEFIKFSIATKKVIVIGFFISLLYNLVGLSFAVQAALSPVIAAILMPISSFSVVLWAVAGTRIVEKSILNSLPKNI